ncbi:MAG: hypothetical protein AUJ52_03345 [Elusimicrobia bacterium CG1_02_63_36]|nr:MAG: hypothetical protein AUJ52_03345 [Elusimicrobia bacterium CG1_02_63_36]PIP82805.1 MAG: hypothetical protein COR54_12970 [Elusimicrobia bacterium CG22_combo_CG10-13_8_21_14_all_63_91]PJA16112.1 MAG: hypothetical protein COX66_08450 [Elusimicrobia bacterium CG_4_10_14_0_2_um_filter_63_34]PJB24699.1 MAG: hypothetical protein CO113_12620 [Elusimicrobia bacterium CG_4_9_14_3_um_filter_62_55]
MGDIFGSRAEDPGTFSVPGSDRSFYLKLSAVAALMYLAPYDRYPVLWVYDRVPLLQNWENGYAFLCALGYALRTAVYAALAYWGMRRLALSPADIGWKRVPLRQLVLPFVAAALAAVFQFWFFEVAVDRRSDIVAQCGWWTKISFDLKPGLSLSDPMFLLNGVVWLFLGSFAEEVIHRGVLFGALRARLGPAAAILLTAAFFPLCHLYPFVDGGGIFLFETFFFGLVLGGLREWSGNLWIPLTAHWIYNALSAWTLLPWVF